MHGAHPRRRGGGHAAAHPRRRQQGLLRRAGRRASCWTRAGWPASAATSPANWWSPSAPARRWRSSRRCWPNRASACAFEPPHFGGGATVGGMVAAGLSGPARASVGAVRDFVLGLSIVNGQGELLSFGGQVMKNVAGYDVSRLMAGALGTLGLIVEVSLKVLPRAPAEATLKLRAAAGRSAAAPERLGRPAAAAQRQLLGRRRRRAARCTCACAAPRRRSRPPAARWAASARTTRGVQGDWRRCRDQRLPWFAGSRRAATCGACRCRRRRRCWTCPSAPLVEWHGGQRWVRRGAGDGERAAPRRAAAGGHATLFRSGARRSAGVPRLQPLAPALDRIHRDLKQPFDPAGIFNRGRLYPELLTVQTQLSPEFPGTPEGAEAEAILRKCVHCGFCTATCPTYQLLGDELDGPRGRIYLIKQVLEGEQPTAQDAAAPGPLPDLPQLREHLPERRGVRPPGRHRPRASSRSKVPRGAAPRALRWALKEGLTSPLFGPAMKLGQAVRGLLPGALQRQGAGAAGRPAPGRRARHARKVLLLAGCVQPAMMPNINSATARVLDAAGIQAVVAPRGRLLRRRQVPPERPGRRPARRCAPTSTPGGRCVERGEVEAIVMNASGCGVTVREYGHHLQHDPAYADKARRISELTRDLSELLPELVPALQDQRARAAGRAGLPPALHAAARPAAARRRREPACAQLGFDVRLRAERIAPVLRLGRHLLGAAAGDGARSCATASSATCDALAPAWRSCRPTSAASRTCKAAPACRCGTGWRCWTRR